MFGRRGKWTASVLAGAVAAGVGVGAYLGGPYALAGEGQRTPVTASTSASSSPTPVEPSQSPSQSPSPTPSSSAPTPAAPKPVAPKPKPKPATGPCARTGPAQLAVERYLAAHPQWGAVTVDGKQSPADCAAIKKFQTRYGVRPAAGLAGPTTGRIVDRLTRANLDRCDTGSGTTICVDLSAQTFWVVRGGDVVLGPAPIRTGRAGLATPAGHFRIGNKKRHTISTIFKVPLPYWQQFNADMGFHQTPSYLYDGDSPGSHGCVNLLRRDAVALYGLTEVGTAVHVYGRKPGT
jgi:lipoprotein-anchoring transpeptidase ErfK/SrfK